MSLSTSSLFVLFPRRNFHLRLLLLLQILFFLLVVPLVTPYFLSVFETSSSVCFGSPWLHIFGTLLFFLVSCYVFETFSSICLGLTSPYLCNFTLSVILNFTPQKRLVSFKKEKQIAPQVSFQGRRKRTHMLLLRKLIFSTNKIPNRHWSYFRAVLKEKVIN